MQAISLAHAQVLMILSTSKLVPDGYRVANIEVIFPMALVTSFHLLWPFALNPWFISFSVSRAMANTKGVCADETSSRWVQGSFWVSHVEFFPLSSRCLFGLQHMMQTICLEVGSMLY